MIKTAISWSGGKDSLMALYALQQSSEYKVTSLITTCTAPYNRVSVHGVRRELLEAQAQSLGLPNIPIWIDTRVTNESYESTMVKGFKRNKKTGIDAVAFGDIYLEDLRKLRAHLTKQAGLKAIFPIWKRDTTSLIQEFISLGFNAVVCCVDTRKLDPSFAGRDIDSQFLNDLPKNVDPCGENGEFHTFVYDGSLFKTPIKFTRGEPVIRDTHFCFCDLIPN